MKMNKLIFSVCAILVLSLILTSCGVATVDNAVYKTPKEFTVRDDFTILEEDGYSFDFVNDGASVVLKDASGKVVWGTSPTDSYGGRLDEYGDPIPLHSKVKSAIIIEYIDPTVSKIYSANSYKDCTQNGHYTVKEIENGIEVTYYFEEFKISVPIAYTYKNGVVRLSVDSSRITEAENKLYSVALAPYSCGVYNLAEDGYLFVPSGSGAIIKPRQLETGLYSYSRELYGEDATRYRERELDSEKFPENLLAVYGAKTSDNTALCAIIEKGAEHAFIEAEVGALNTNYSSVWPKFTFRAYQWSKIKNEQQVKLYSDDMSQDTVSVAFHLLDGDNADYVGMANTYREYLTDKYGMQTSNDDSLLNLKIVGGVNITETVLGFKYDKFYQTTTLSQAKDMISDLSSAVDGTITADLIGFGQSGIDVKTIAGGYTVASKLGGEKGLKELSKLAKKNDCNLFFNVDVLGFSNSGKGISKEFDTALAQNNQKIKQYYYNIYLRKKTAEHKPYYLLERALLSDVCEKLADEFSDIGINGFGLDTLSSVCYSDYRQVKYFNKGNMAADVSKVMSTLNKDYAIAVNSANDYAAASADMIYDVPITSSKDNIFSYDVPFYSIVFKGYIPIATPSVNLSADADSIILAAAEIGAGLSYTLINNSSTKLIDSFSSAFYGSVYDDIKSEIHEHIKEYSENFKLVENAKIIDHIILENGLHKTVFDNGVTVYTNYTSIALTVNDNHIESGNYLFVKE